MRADHLKVAEADYVCGKCIKGKKAEETFFASLGESRSLIKDTFVRDGRRWILIDCQECGGECWLRLDNWQLGRQKCWGCAHPRSLQIRHGKTGTALFNRWQDMIRRTEYSKEPDKIRVYQARGIKVCDEWRRDFEAFEGWALENDFSPELYLDRIDNSKGYSPDNCRWVTAKESTDNRRKAVYLDAADQIREPESGRSEHKD
jgi:hypothetical protein